ncbi:unnamed protein product [Xylocopa violacea]|uniref:RNA (guanine-9-)-methyltransferase domain-containing protein 1 n=1 Tax=Xylocopa violacea TaxID=135666 RepID=A0ABP1PEH7_XYLVO
MNTIKFVAFTIQSYSKLFIQLKEPKLMVSQFRFSVETHRLLTRSYSDFNPTKIIYNEYNKKDEEKLMELLKEPRYQALYDKCKIEMEFIKCITGKLPKTLRPCDWLHLLKLSSKGHRRSFLEFRWKVEKKEEHRKEKMELKHTLVKEPETDNDSLYGLHKNSLFHRIRDKQINHFYNSRLINAILYEPVIVFDLDYHKCMMPREQLNCAKQLLLSFSSNRSHNNPFNLYFCNVNKNSLIMETLHKMLPHLYDIDFPLNITSESYLEMFPKEKLVYLTPNANRIMTKYDPNLIYIIGAMVDKQNPKPLSFQKANAEKIRMMKFPLSEKLKWGTGSSKNLPLNQVLSILLDLRDTNDWKIAMDHVPKRKLREAREDSMRRLMTKRKLELENIKNTQ